MDSESCYGGGDIAGAIFGTLFAVVLVGVLLWWLYRKNYILKRKDPQLMPDDPEATAKGEYAFDNPAFKTTEGGPAGINGGPGGTGTASKTVAGGSPLDPSWTSKQNTIEKRKTVDDSYVPAATTPRLVALRGSDFTGLGVEVYGGLKEGIFVKKVMPQGPAAGLVNAGDRITSITIDFRHIVQEDAMTILSYASPYNVQLELVSGTKPIVPQTQSPKPGHQSLTHPLYRSSSQSDLNTIERNSRKKLFPSEDSPLKMDNRAASPTTAGKPLPTVHREHEREPKKHSSFKQQMREMIEEKFQSRHADVERKASAAGEEPASGGQRKGHKFGIRVFPPSVNDKLFGRSPTKVQADNENNTNIERKEADDGGRRPSPPVVKKRTKDVPKVVPDVVVVGEAEQKEDQQQTAKAVAAMDVPTSTTTTMEFQRQNSLTSSGIRRDAAGIPQEMPSFMMQAANAARDNRKSAAAAMTAAAVSEADSKRNKGKAPRPPQNECAELDESTVTMDTNLSGSADSGLHRRMNFSDNFAEEVLNCTIDSINTIEQFDETGPSNSSTPKSARKQQDEHQQQHQQQSMLSMEEAAKGDDGGRGSNEEEEMPRVGNKIELNSSDITVHRSSPSPAPPTEQQQQQQQREDEPMDESNRRTASLGDLSKPKPSGTESVSSTLERAQSLEIPASDSEGGGGVEGTETGPVEGVPKRRRPSSERVSVEVKGDMPDGMSSLQRNRLKGASAWGNLEDAFNSGELGQNGTHDENGEEENEEEDVIEEKEQEDDQKDKRTLVTAQVVVVSENGWSTEQEHGLGKQTVRNQAIIVAEAPKKPPVEPIEPMERAEEQQHVSLTTIGGAVVETGYHPPAGAQLVKITAGYDTNIPDDVKVSRYPFGSLERPKSDVLKKLLGQQEELENTPSVFISANDEIEGDNDDSAGGEGTTVGAKIKIETGALHLHGHGHGRQRSFEVGEPISLTLINPGSTEIVAGGYQPDGGEQTVVTSSNTNGVSSINISPMVSAGGAEFGDEPPRLTNGGFALLADNIVTISTGAEGTLDAISQPSSIVMIDDEKLDFSLQTLEDFDEPMPMDEPPPPVDFANSSKDSKDDNNDGENVDQQQQQQQQQGEGSNDMNRNSMDKEEQPEPSEPQSKAMVEPPQPPRRSSITMHRRGSNGTLLPAPITNGVGFVTEITLKTSQSQEPPTAAERPHQLNGVLLRGKGTDEPTAPTNTTGKPPIAAKKPPKPDHKPTAAPAPATTIPTAITPPSRIPVERRMSSEHSFIPRNSEIKFTTATYDTPRTPTAQSPGANGGIHQLRSAFERSNSKTEIPVLIRRTSIPSINLSSSSVGGGAAGGSMSNLSSIAGGQSHQTTKASPSRIPVFNSVGSGKHGTTAAQNGHGGEPPLANGGPRSPPSPPTPQTNGHTNGLQYHHNNNNNNNNNNNLVNNKVSVSITSIKNQAKYPSGKF